MALLDWDVTKKITPHAKAPIGDPKEPQDPNRPPLGFRVDFHFFNRVTLKSFDYFEPDCLDVRPAVIDSKAYNQLAQIEGVASLPIVEQSVDLSQFLPKEVIPPSEDDLAVSAFTALVRAWQLAQAKRKLLAKDATQAEIDAADASIDVAAVAIKQAYAPLDDKGEPVQVSAELAKRFDEAYVSQTQRTGL